MDEYKECSLRRVRILEKKIDKNSGKNSGDMLTGREEKLLRSILNMFGSPDCVQTKENVISKRGTHYGNRALAFFSHSTIACAMNE